MAETENTDAILPDAVVELRNGQLIRLSPPMSTVSLTGFLHQLEPLYGSEVEVVGWSSAPSKSTSNLQVESVRAVGAESPSRQARAQVLEHPLIVRKAKGTQNVCLMLGKQLVVCFLPPRFGSVLARSQDLAWSPKQ